MRNSLVKFFFLALILSFVGPLWAQKTSISYLDSLIEKGKTELYASPKRSMEMAAEILHLSDSLNYEKGKLEGIRLVGNSHYLLGQLDSASYYMLRLLNMADDAGDLGMQADVMIDIGQTYDKIGMYSLAYDYYWQAHNIRLEMGDPERLSVTFINLAYHYYLRDELDSALYFYEQTENILDTIPLTHTKPFLYNEIGGVYLKQGKIKEARENINKAIYLNKELENNWDLSYNYTNLANLELQVGNIDLAEENAYQALRVSKESGIVIEYDLIYHVLSKVKSLQGDYKESLDYLEQSYAYSDSLESALNDQQIIALDYYKKEKENEISTLRLKNENLAQNVRLTVQRNILISIAIILVLALIGVALLLKQNRKLKEAKLKIQDQNNDLKKLNTTKNKLISIITHDIRNPLSNINGMLKLAHDGHITSSEFNSYAGSLADQTNRLTTLSETLINWSRSQEKGLVASRDSINMDDLIKQSMHYVTYMADNKSVELVYNPGSLKSVKADANMMVLVMNNLLTNAIKFTPSGGIVKVLAEEEEKCLRVDITDTGIGIEEDLIEKLHKGQLVMQPGTDEEKGTGIGLLLTLDLITLNNGKLKARRNPDKGSTFSICIPYD